MGGREAGSGAGKREVVVAGPLHSGTNTHRYVSVLADMCLMASHGLMTLTGKAKVCVDPSRSPLHK